MGKTQREIGPLGVEGTRLGAIDNEVLRPNRLRVNERSTASVNEKDNVGWKNRTPQIEKKTNERTYL